MGILPNLVGTVEAVCVGAVGEIDSGRRKIVSALIKTPVPGRIAVGPLGLPGDEHVYEDHGGPDLALLAYPREHYDYWRDIGLELPVAGAMGENLTTTGLVETEVHIGDVFKVGTSVIQVSETRSPCSKLAARFGRKDMAVMMQDTGFVGDGLSCSLRVLECRPRWRSRATHAATGWRPATIITRWRILAASVAGGWCRWRPPRRRSVDGGRLRSASTPSSSRRARRRKDLVGASGARPRGRRCGRSCGPCQPFDTRVPPEARDSHSTTCSANGAAVAPAALGGPPSSCRS